MPPQGFFDALISLLRLNYTRSILFESLNKNYLLQKHSTNEINVPVHVHCMYI